MITTTLTDLPTPPQSTDPANFNVRADAFVAALDVFQPEMNTVIGEINSTATDVNNDAVSASESALIAEGAANYQGDWVAGTYSLGQSVSYLGYRYVSKINGNTDTPPSANWLTIGIDGETHAATTKTTPVDADEIPLVDSAAFFGLKKLTWANLKAALVTYLTITTGFSILLGATGYIKFPSWLGGIIFQWGSYTAATTSGDTNITFPITYLNGALQTFAHDPNSNLGSGSTAFIVSAVAVNASSFNLQWKNIIGTSNASTINWFSIGY